jgi:hypothetical protein
MTIGAKGEAGEGASGGWAGGIIPDPATQPKGLQFHISTGRVVQF